MTGPEIILREMMPNLLPYLAATLVNAVSAAILASIGLEVLGLGPLESPTLGMTLYWINFNAAILNGWWWWWVAPIVIIVIGVPRPVLPHRRARRNRQSPPAAIGMNAPVLRVEGLRVSVRPSARRGARGGRCVVQPAPARTLRAGRRIGLRQIDHGAGDPAPDPPAGTDRWRRGLAGRHEAFLAVGRRHAQAAAGRHRAGAARLDERAQPGAAHSRADRRRARRSRHAVVARAKPTRMCAICSARSVCRPMLRTCIRTNSPAA